jgi:tetratricopeptide (TPR) repeat protein
MNHREMKQRVLFLADGILDQAKAAPVRAHLKECETCKKLFAGATSSLKHMRAGGDATAFMESLDIEAMVDSAIRRTSNNRIIPGRFGRKGPLRVFALAAVLILAIGTGFYVYVMVKPGIGSTQTASRFAMLSPSASPASAIATGKELPANGALPSQDLFRARANSTQTDTDHEQYLVIARIINRGDFSIALAAIQSYLAQHKTNRMSAYTDLGYCLARLGHFDRAVQAYQTVVDSSKDSQTVESALHSVSRIYLHKLKDYAAARAHAKAYLERYPAGRYREQELAYLFRTGQKLHDRAAVAWALETLKQEFPGRDAAAIISMNLADTIAQTGPMVR